MPTALLKLAERFPVIVSVELAAVIVTLSWWSGGNVELLTVDARLWQGQVWRLFSSVLPHVNIIHLAFNPIRPMPKLARPPKRSKYRRQWTISFAGRLVDLLWDGLGRPSSASPCQTAPSIE